MTLIKITDKRSNLGLKFEHPIVLNPEKEYKLGVSRLMFSFDKEVKIDLRFDFFIPIPDTKDVITVSAGISWDYTINSLQKAFQQKCDEFNLIIKNMK